MQFSLIVMVQLLRWFPNKKMQKCYRRCLYSLNTIVQKYHTIRWPTSQVGGVKFLHDNAPAHTVKYPQDLLLENELHHLDFHTYQTDLFPYSVFLFPKFNFFQHIGEQTLFHWWLISKCTLCWMHVILFYQWWSFWTKRIRFYQIVLKTSVPRIKEYFNGIGNFEGVCTNFFLQNLW